MKIRTIIFLLSFGFLAGCSEDEPTLISGDIVGSVGYYESDHINFIDSLAGVNVELKSSDGLSLTTTTDATGRFMFSNMKAGNYTISVYKDDFAFYTNGVFYNQPLEKDLIHLGGGTTNAGFFEFYEIPVYDTGFDSYEWIGDTVLQLNLSVPPGEHDYHLFYVYLSETSDLSIDNYDFIWESEDSRLYLGDEYISADPLTGKIVLKLPFLREDFNYYVMVRSCSVWWYTLAGPASNVILVAP